MPGSGLVYLRSRGETKDIARFLQEQRISADFYHAGLSMEERSQKQEAWISGRTRIMACTNAFGMGIDKPDVRLVVHLNLPDSLEAYFQEAGRAGRDGKKSYAVLVYAPGDADTLRFHLQSAYPEMELVRRVYSALGSVSQLAIGGGLGESFPFDLQHFCLTYKFEQGPAFSALKLLEQEGWIALSDASGAMPRVFISATREALYDYQLRHKQADTVTKVLLRAYPGVQRDFVEISIPSLGRYAKMEAEAVEQTLETAQKEGILDYQPAQSRPQLTFTRERVAAENLTIDTERFNFRKQRAEIRTAEAIRYAETRKCRSRQLLAYFGQTDSKPCGICDVCTGRNQSDVPEDVFEALERKIMALLQRERLTAAEVLGAFSARQQEQVDKVLAYLLDEGKVEEGEDGRLAVG